jgi:hypothetical protein
VLVEKFPCESKDELHARERYYIENNECVNKYIPNRTNAEYRQDNIIHLKAHAKEYREKNRVTINLKQSEKHFCECGGKYGKSHKLRHKESKKHQAYEARKISLSA